MSRASPGEYLQLIDEMALLLQESKLFHAKRLRSTDSRPGATSLTELDLLLLDGLGKLQHLRKRVQASTDRAVVTFVGLGNVGKSTLLNALLGSDIAPRRNGPCTAAPIEFCYGSQIKVVSIHAGQLERRQRYPNDSAALRECLSQLADEEAMSGTARPMRVEVQLPLPLLQSGLVIADTPGFGSAQHGDSKGSHDAALREYLLTEATQVFWVVLAEQGIGKSEKAMYDAMFAEVCDDVLVTGSEDWDADERQRFRKRFNTLLSSGSSKKSPFFHFVSGLRGLDARKQGDEDALELAGIPALESRVRQMAEGPGRVAAADAGLIQLAEDLRYWLMALRDVHGRRIDPWWRPDSLSRWSAVKTPLPVHKAITEALRPPSPSTGR